MARTVRNFNLENQAEWEISRMKPSPAPRHPFTKNLLQEQMSSHPEIKGEIDRKDELKSHNDLFLGIQLVTSLLSCL